MRRIVTCLIVCLLAACTGSVYAQQPQPTQITAKVFDDFITPRITATAVVFEIVFNTKINVGGAPTSDYKGRTVVRDPVTQGILKAVHNVLPLSKASYL